MNNNINLCYNGDTVTEVCSRDKAKQYKILRNWYTGEPNNINFDVVDTIWYTKEGVTSYI